MPGFSELEWGIPPSPLARALLTDSQGLSLLLRFTHVCTGDKFQCWLPLWGLAPLRVSRCEVGGRG